MSSFNRNLPPTGDVFVNPRTTFDAGLREHMLRVYNYMGLGLGISGLLAYLVSTNEFLSQMIFGSPLIFLVMIAPLGFILFLSFKIQTMTVSTAKTVFFAFSAVMGLSLATIFLRYTNQSVLNVFLITASMFAGTSLIGYTTKKDLSGLGGLFTMALIGLLVAIIVNYLMASSALQFMISVAGILIFVGLTAYDTQRIKVMYSSKASQESNDKLAVMGALELYLDFINMFRFMLYFMGDRR